MKLIMCGSYGGGRIEIFEELTEREAKELAELEELSTLQFSEPVTDKTFELLEKYLFSKRDDVVLRVYGFYVSLCDLSFLKKVPSVKRLYIECDGEVKNLAYITSLRFLKELDLSVYSLESFDILYEVTGQLEELTLGQTKSKKPNLQILKHFPSLKRLYIEKHTKHIEILSTLTDLEELTLKSISVPDLSFLLPLQNLTILKVHLGGIQDFFAIQHLKQLKFLEFWQVRGLSDLSFISFIPTLQQLVLQSLKIVERLPNFKHSFALRKLSMENMKGLQNIESLKSAPSLIEFTHWSAMKMELKDYIPLLQNPTVEKVTVLFGSDKRNKQFEDLAIKYGKDPLWTED